MKNLIIILTLFMLSIQTSYASLKVSPTIIELNSKSTKGNYITSSFNVGCSKNETVRFKVYPSYFEITENGKMNEIPVSNSPNSLVNHVGIVPNEFTISNGATQKVRFTIAGIKNLPDGENRMVLFLEDVKPKELILPYYQKDVTTKLIIKSRVGIPVYLDNGKFVKCAHFDNLSVSKNKNIILAKLEFSALGNSKVRYTGKAQIIKDKKLISESPISSNTIKNNGKLTITEEIPINNIKEIGEYNLRVIVNYENEKGNIKNMVKEIPFVIDKLEHSQI